MHFPAVFKIKNKLQRRDSDGKKGPNCGIFKVWAEGEA